MITITQEQAGNFYNRFLNQCEEHYNIYLNIQGHYRDYDDMLQKFIRYFGVKDGMPKNTLDISMNKSKDNFITYDNYRYLLVAINQFFSTDKFQFLENRKKYLKSLVVPTSYILFTHVSDFINYMEPDNWVDYYAYTALYYDYRIENAMQVKTEHSCALDIGDWVFDQYGNELTVTEILEGDFIKFRDSGVRLNNNLFVDYKIISETGKFEDSYINKPDYDKPINVKHKYVIPAQTTTHCSKIIDIKIDKIRIIVDRDVINGSYKSIEI